MIGIILRAGENGLKELQELQEKYNFPEAFINGIADFELKPDLQTREFMREIRQPERGEKYKLGAGDEKRAKAIYSDKLKQELNLTFFRKSLDDIRTGLEILSQAEHNAIMSYIEAENNLNDPFQRKNIRGAIKFERIKNGEEECIIIRNQNFEKEAKKLRDKIEVDKLKEELKIVKENGTKEQIAEKELEIANIILRELENGFHYILNGDDNGYKPIEIQKTKEVYCTGFSIIGHAILSEFGIKHKGLDILDHSALEIHIGDDKYYFDPTGNSKNIYKVIKAEGQEGSVYKKYTLDGTDYTYKAFSGDTEKLLLSELYNNKGNALFDSKDYKGTIKMCDEAIKLNPKCPGFYYNKGNALYYLKDYNGAIKMYDEAIKLNPKVAEFYYGKGNALYYLKDYNGAIKMYDEAIKLDPNNLDYYYNKGNALYYLKDYNGSIKMYDEAIKLDPNNPDYYYNKGNALYYLKDYNGSIKMYDEAIKLDPNNPDYYYNKGNALSRLWNFKLSNLIFYAVKKLEGTLLSTTENENIEEKRKINDFIGKQDYEGLRIYLLSLEN